MGGYHSSRKHSTCSLRGKAREDITKEFISKMNQHQSNAGSKMSEQLKDFNSIKFETDFRNEVIENCNKINYFCPSYNELFKGIIKGTDTKFTNNLMKFIFIYNGNVTIQKIGGESGDH